MDIEVALFLVGYILFSTTKNDLLPSELLPFSGIPVLINFWLLSEHFNLMKQIIAEVHPNKVQRKEGSTLTSLWMDYFLFSSSGKSSDNL